MKEYKIKAKIYKKHKSRYIKISKNQFRIMESLYIDGSNEKKYYDNNNELRFTEHSGLLDFGKSTLQKIIINGRVVFYLLENLGYNIFLGRSYRSKK